MGKHHTNVAIIQENKKKQLELEEPRSLNTIRSMEMDKPGEA